MDGRNELEFYFGGRSVAHNVWFHVTIRIGQSDFGEREKVQELPVTKEGTNDKSCVFPQDLIAA